MSDITIPGVTSNLNTGKIIEDLMKLERIPLERMEKSLDTYREQKRVWQGVNRKISSLRENARILFGFENPFSDRVAASSREDVITATATRQAEEGETSITVKSLAKPDRLLSSSLPKDFRVPEGVYTFSVGDEQISFKFPGGSLEAFAKKLNAEGKGLIQARVVQDTPDTQVLLIESTRPGKANKLRFQDDSLDLALKTGILTEIESESYRFSLEKSALRPWTEPIDDTIYPAEAGGLTFSPETEAFLPSERRISARDNLMLEIAYSVEMEGTDTEQPQPPPGPGIPKPGSVEVEDITIENSPSETYIPQWEAPEGPKSVTDLQVFYADENGRAVELPEIQGSSGKHTLNVPLSEYVSSLTGIRVRNLNTHRTVTLSSIRVIDPDARDGYVPANPISEASDAEITVDGITITRDTNTIDDVIPGVTLELQGTGEQPVQLTVKPDREEIKNSIIQFVGHYNQLMTEIQVLTREDESLIDELEYLSEDEREQYIERLGLMQGDITLNQLRSRLQTIMMDPYPTGTEGGPSLLAQIGISTNAAGPTTNFDAVQLRGYLQINEEELDTALQSNLRGIKDLFGYDTDGDRIIDSGVAFAVDQYTHAYTRSGGIIATKMQTIDQQIARTNRDIESMQDRLERKEDELERKYGDMEGALESMQEQSKALDNLNRKSQ